MNNTTTEAVDPTKGKHVDKKKLREDNQMLKDIANKIDFSSTQTILEFSNRKKAGKDPHYRKPISDPAG